MLYAIIFRYIYKQKMYNKYWGQRMKKKIVILSMVAVFLLILFPMSSVVGIQTGYERNKKANSPLFAHRHDIQTSIQSTHVGQHRSLHLFFTQRTSQQLTSNRIYTMISSQPHLLISLGESLIKKPEFQQILNQYSISKEEFTAELNKIIQHPELFSEQIDSAVLLSSVGNSQQPLGLSTSNPLGCFIVALVLAPIFAIIGGIIATLTIITCLNINGCFENLVQNLLDSLLQGLTPEPN